MSKMFEALRKAQQEGTATNLPLSAVADAMDLHPPVRETAPPHDAAGRDVPVYEDSSPGGLRQVPAHFSSGSVVIPWNLTDTAGAEHYRIIRTRIVQHPQRPRLMVVSSAGPGDGKTVSSINIAGVLSLRDNATVLLVDADFRRSSVASVLGLPSEPGLANVLDGSCGLQEAILRVEQFPNLYVLPAGASIANSAELLDTEHWTALSKTVRDRFSFVIVDGPPIAAVADYELIQDRCEGVIVVVRPDHTDRTLFSKAFELIPETKRLGVVLNCASEWLLWKTHESYYYGSRAKR